MGLLFLMCLLLTSIEPDGKRWMWSKMKRERAQKMPVQYSPLLCLFPINRFCLYYLIECPGPWYIVLQIIIVIASIFYSR